MNIISSKDNELIKNIKKLKEKKYRDINNQYIIEGIKLIKEAIIEKANIKLIVICEECLVDGTIDKNLLYEIAKYECIYVTEKIFTQISDVKAPQGILAIIEKGCKQGQIDYSEDIIIALDGIQDPGNLGTILRTVDSANLKQIIVSADTADCYNPKVVRSTMGSIFRIPVYRDIPADDVFAAMDSAEINTYAAVVDRDAVDIKTVDFRNGGGIVIGNEGNGLPEEIILKCTQRITIKMNGNIDSLNAAMATGIIMWELMKFE